MKLIPLKKTREGNAAYTGLPGELVGLPSVGVALHDGVTPGGILLEPNPTFYQLEIEFPISL